MTFLARDKVAFVEDAGDTLHTQRNALDSGYVFDTHTDYSTGAQPVRFLAEGRDAVGDDRLWPARLAGLPERGRQRDHRHPRLRRRPHCAGASSAPRCPLFSFSDGRSPLRWRLFYTAQHGDNVTWEILPARVGHGGY